MVFFPDEYCCMHAGWYAVASIGPAPSLGTRGKKRRLHVGDTEKLAYVGRRVVDEATGLSTSRLNRQAGHVSPHQEGARWAKDGQDGRTVDVPHDGVSEIRMLKKPVLFASQDAPFPTTLMAMTSSSCSPSHNPRRFPSRLIVQQPS